MKRRVAAPRDAAHSAPAGSGGSFTRREALLAAAALAWVPAGARRGRRGGLDVCTFTDRCTEYDRLVWPSDLPEDCPLERSTVLRGMAFTGRWANYTQCDYWYPTWAADGHLYSGCGDGLLCGRQISNAGIARIAGDDPLNLEFGYLGSFNVKAGSAYICTSLAKGGVWHLGIEEGWNALSAEGVARFGGFLRGAPGSPAGELGFPPGDHPRWKDRTRHPLRDATPRARKTGGFFGEPEGRTRTRNPHFVDFGQEMRHSPDGLAYLLCHGCEGEKPAEWGNGDSVYLMRVAPEARSLDDPRRWEFYAGRNAAGTPVWSRKPADLRPILTWPGRLGLAHAVYHPALRRYLLCVSPLLVADTWTAEQKPEKRWHAEGALLLEAQDLTGPWRVAQYLAGFGPDAYCLCLPSKFLHADGVRAWLLCSANWTQPQHPGNPRGMRYAAHFREVELLTA